MKKQKPVKAANKVKFYSIIRSAHLERELDSNDTWILYSKTNYDFDEGLLTGHDLLRKISPWRLPRFLRKHSIETLEVNEPLMLPAWHVLLPILILRVFHPSMRRPLQLVFYAIENLDPSANLAARLHLPHRMAHKVISVVCRLAFRAADRVAFGTQGSMKLYASLLGPHWRKAEAQSKLRQIDPLPSPEVVGVDEKILGSVLFLGDLSTRKGIIRLMSAWEILPAGHGLTLRIVGIGEELEKVEAWARTRPEVDLVISPSRSVIRQTLARSETLVLLSRTSAIWREQIGLPLLEGWSYGCNLIATDATGIAGLLERSGHTVLPENFTDVMLVDALIGAEAPRRSPRVIQEDLPKVDGRLTADLWLNEPRCMDGTGSGIRS